MAGLGLTAFFKIRTNHGESEAKGGRTNLSWMIVPREKGQQKLSKKCLIRFFCEPARVVMLLKIVSRRLLIQLLVLVPIT